MVRRVRPGLPHIPGGVFERLEGVLPHPRPRADKVVEADPVVELLRDHAVHGRLVKI